MDQPGHSKNRPTTAPAEHPNQRQYRGSVVEADGVLVARESQKAGINDHDFCSGLKVTVCHYPPGASKWNPIEHRLFSKISRNWAGRPLESYETVVKYIRSTTTSTGLEVSARLLRKRYEKGEAISDQEMKQVVLTNHKTLPGWNYTLTPSTV
jgi:hypothetical protein